MDQQALLTEALALLPAGVRVTVHGDSEFRSQELFQWLRAQGHDALLGSTGSTFVDDMRAPHAPSSTLEARVGTKTEVIRLSHVYLTQAQAGPVMCWRGGIKMTMASRWCAA